MGALYKIENTINGKCYYGQTTKNGEYRIKTHIRDFKANRHNNDHMQKTWNKHGETVFKFDIIADDIPDDQLDQLEIKLIEIFQTMNPDFGYNKVTGGNKNKRFSQESKEKNRQSQLRYLANGGKPAWLGKKHSQQSIEKSKKTKKETFSNPNYVSPHRGKVYSDYTKELMRQAKLQFYANGGVNNTKGKSLPPEVRKKISISNMGQKAHNIEPCIGPDGFIYPSLSIAAKMLGVPLPTVRSSVRLKRPYKGNQFYYLVEKNQEAIDAKLADIIVI